jgi:single-strand DNA-binding protein
MNKVILIGNVGRDAELAYTTTNTGVCKFSLATTETFKEKKTTEWHNVVMFGTRAEKLAQYITKGCQLIVEGKVTYRSWDGKDGAKHYRTEIICENIEFTGSNKKEYKAEVASESVLDKEYTVSTDQTFTQADIPF